MNNAEIKLQVLICTFGAEGIRKVAESIHPQVRGVEYLVSWQLPDPAVSHEIPDELKRPDFNISIIHSKGLSKNRNNLLSLASAPYCLISDDDVDYTTEGLETVIHTFDADPNLDIATFRFEGNEKKVYPDFSFNLRYPPKGYFFSSIEIAFRLESVMETGILFDERFGIGAEFPSGEEGIWMHSLLRYGLKGKYFPLTIESHKDDSTGFRMKDTPEFIRTKGAAIQTMFPLSWPLRMVSHALRYNTAEGSMSRWGYIRAWLSGTSYSPSWLIPPVIIMIIVFILSMLSYWQEDAIAFSYFMPLQENNHSYVPFNSLLEIPESMGNHYMHGTGRILSHALAQFFCGFAGQTIFALFNAMMWGVFIILLTRLAKVTVRATFNTLMASALTFLLFFAFGSEHTFPFEPPHQIDYVWMGAVNIIWLLQFFSRKRNSSVSNLILLAFLSLLCGEANEAFSVPIGGGLLIYLIASRFRLTSRQWVMGAAYGIGALICIMAPGNFERISEGGEYSLLHTTENLLPSLLIPAIGLVSIVLARKRIRGREESKQRYALFIGSVIVINYIFEIAVGMGSGSRIVTCANMLICATILHIWRGRKLKSPLSLICVALLIILVSLRVSAIETLAHKNKSIVEGYRNSTSGIVVIPDSLFLYEVRKSIIRPLPYMKRERIMSPEKPDLRIRPQSMSILPLDKDTNMLIRISPQAWLMIRSKANPFDFTVRKNLLPGLINRRMADRTLDWDSHTSDICFDSTALWKAGIYVNDRPYIKAEVVMTGSSK